MHPAAPLPTATPTQTVRPASTLPSAPTSTFAPLKDRTTVFDLVRPGLFRKDPENLTVLGNVGGSYASFNDAVIAAKEVAVPRTADVAIIRNNGAFGLQSLVDSHGPGPGGPFDVAYNLKLKPRDYFRYVHPKLEGVVSPTGVTTRDQLLAILRQPTQLAPTTTH